MEDTLSVNERVEWSAGQKRLVTTQNKSNIGQPLPSQCPEVWRLPFECSGTMKCALSDGPAVWFVPWCTCRSVDGVSFHVRSGAACRCFVNTDYERAGVSEETASAPTPPDLRSLSTRLVFVEPWTKHSPEIDMLFRDERRIWPWVVLKRSTGGKVLALTWSDLVTGFSPSLVHTLVQGEFQV